MCSTSKLIKTNKSHSCVKEKRGTLNKTIFHLLAVIKLKFHVHFMWLCMINCLRECVDGKVIKKRDKNKWFWIFHIEILLISLNGSSFIVLITIKSLPPRLVNRFLIAPFLTAQKWKFTTNYQNVITQFLLIGTVFLLLNPFCAIKSFLFILLYKWKAPVSLFSTMKRPTL